MSLKNVKKTSEELDGIVKEMVDQHIEAHTLHVIGQPMYYDSALSLESYGESNARALQVLNESPVKEYVVTVTALCENNDVVTMHTHHTGEKVRSTGFKLMESGKETFDQMAGQHPCYADSAEGPIFGNKYLDITQG